MLFTWIKAKGFSRLLIRAASCCSSSSTIDAKVTGASTEGAGNEEHSQGLKEQELWVFIHLAKFLHTKSPLKYSLTVLHFFLVTYNVRGPGSFCIQLTEWQSDKQKQGELIFYLDWCCRENFGNTKKWNGAKLYN